MKSNIRMRRAFLMMFLALMATNTLSAQVDSRRKTSGEEEKTKVESDTTKTYKLKGGKVEDAVVGTYQKIENGVVNGYHVVEDAFVGTYKKIEDKFVESFLEEKTENTNTNKE